MLGAGLQARPFHISINVIRDRYPRSTAIGKSEYSKNCIFRVVRAFRGEQIFPIDAKNSPFFKKNYSVHRYFNCIL